MNGEKNEPDDLLDDDSAEDLSAETVVLTEVDDGDIIDTTVEMKIEKLVAKLEDSDSEDVHRKAEIRRRLEQLREQRERELDSTYNINLDDD